MLLQTLVQLNILILATPALAGWSVLPPVHAGTVRAAGIIWQFRAVEPAATKSVAAVRTHQPAAIAPLPVAAPLVHSGAVFAAALSAAPASLTTLPYAARAP